jgi:hypothetical protein
MNSATQKAGPADADEVLVILFASADLAVMLREHAGNLKVSERSTTPRQASRFLPWQFQHRLPSSDQEHR